MSELSRLMVKAVRSLPAEEQDALLEAMLEPRLAPWPGPGGPGLPSPADLLAGQSSRSTGSTARTLATRSPSRRSAPRPAGPGRASRSASPPTSTSASSSGARPTASPWRWCSAAWSRASSTTRRPGPPAPHPLALRRGGRPAGRAARSPASGCRGPDRGLSGRGEAAQPRPVCLSRRRPPEGRSRPPNGVLRAVHRGPCWPGPPARRERAGRRRPGGVPGWRPARPRRPGGRPRRRRGGWW